MRRMRPSGSIGRSVRRRGVSALPLQGLGRPEHMLSSWSTLYNRSRHCKCALRFERIPPSKDSNMRDSDSERRAIETDLPCLRKSRWTRMAGRLKQGVGEREVDSSLGGGRRRNQGESHPSGAIWTSDNHRTIFRVTTGAYRRHYRLRTRPRNLSAGLQPVVHTAGTISSCGRSGIPAFFHVRVSAILHPHHLPPQDVRRCGDLYPVLHPNIVPTHPHGGFTVANGSRLQKSFREYYPPRSVCWIIRGTPHPLKLRLEGGITITDLCCSRKLKFSRVLP